MDFYRVMADVLVVVHALFVASVILALVLILLGMVLRWRWIHNFWFRVVHLAMIAVVVLQAVFGIECPLTTWESQLRIKSGGEPYPGAFIAYWAHELLFYRGPPWVFTVSYCAFGALVLATWLVAPPQWPWKTAERVSHPK